MVRYIQQYNPLTLTIEFIKLPNTGYRLMYSPVSVIAALPTVAVGLFTASPAINVKVGGM